MSVANVIVIILVCIGLFFTFAGVVGIIRMPDTLCRLQSSTNIATMGAMPIAIACSVYGFSNGNTCIGVKSIIIVIFLLITNPVASHAMARAAYKTGECTKKKWDHYGRDKK